MKIYADDIALYMETIVRGSLIVSAFLSSMLFLLSTCDEEKSNDFKGTDLHQAYKSCMLEYYRNTFVENDSLVSALFFYEGHVTFEPNLIQI